MESEKHKNNELTSVINEIKLNSEEHKISQENSVKLATTELRKLQEELDKVQIEKKQITEERDSMKSKLENRESEYNEEICSLTEKFENEKQIFLEAENKNRHEIVNTFKKDISEFKIQIEHLEKEQELSKTKYLANEQKMADTISKLELLLKEKE